MTDSLSALRQHLVPYLTDGEVSRADSLLHQARVMIGETAERARMRQALQAEQQVQTLREVGTTLITTFDTGKMMDVLADSLPRLGIPSASLSLYEDPESPAGWSRLVLAYDEEGRARPEAEGQRFPSHRLAPGGMLPQERQYCMVVEPLYFRERQLGFVLFEVGPREGSVYESLRGELSSALQGALLLRERQRAEEDLERAYAEVERQVEERTAELRREVAERLRAQEESARLQQEVIEAQRHAIQELSTPVIPVMDRIIVVPLIGSIDTMRARDITRKLLAGIGEHRTKVVILDITGVPIVDSGVASHLNRTIRAARLKGARTIITGISDAVAETIVDLCIDWGDIETLADLQSGLLAALAHVGRRIERQR
jgi:anti-anti-sigma regulatory factor